MGARIRELLGHKASFMKAMPTESMTDLVKISGSHGDVLAYMGCRDRLRNRDRLRASGGMADALASGASAH